MIRNKLFVWLFSCFLAWINSSFLFTPSGDEKISTIPNYKYDYSMYDFDTIRTDLDEYIWPTNASEKITSSFAEYRTKHFHGGIDISTNGQTGYKVFTVQDGYVYRIWITPNGYGKMLFIKHHDGFFSTYAHLQTFNDIINQTARKEQYRTGTYAINLVLDSNQVPVKKGDVIAYTGDTGFGPPHLHFELRDENLNPVNPLLSHNFLIVDEISPVIRRLMIKPLSYDATINNDKRPIYLSRFPRFKNTFLIPQSIKLHGRVGFCIDTEDRANGTWSETGIHRIEFYLDDSLTFSMILNRLPVENTKQIDLHYDFPSVLDGRGRFQKLFIEKGNSLPFFNHLPEGTGIIDTEILTAGEHNYKIIVLDIQGNKSELNGTIIANHNPSIQFTHVNENEIGLTGINLDDIEKYIVFGKRAYQSNWSQHTLTENRFELTKNEILLPVNTKPYDVIKIIAHTKYGSESQPIYRFIKKPLGPARDVHIQTDVLHDYVLFTITTPGVFTESPEIVVDENNITKTLTASAIDINKYQAVYVPSDDYHSNRIVKVDAEVNGKQVLVSSDFLLFPISPNKANSFSFDNGSIIISYDSGAVFKPLYMQIEKGKYNRFTTYNIEPQDILLNRGIRISVRSDEIDNYTGLYYRSTHGWIFQTSEINRESNSLSTLLTHSLGEIGLLKDNAPPTFGRFRLRHYNRNLNISFRYHDNLSGVDTDEIKMYLDDELIIPEIDGEHRKVWYNSQESLEKGKHTVRITMKDKMKNESQLVRTFNVK